MLVFLILFPTQPCDIYLFLFYFIFYFIIFYFIL